VGAKPGQPSNGIRGDARPSTPELGKMIFDMKVDEAVKQIRGFENAAAAPAAGQK
jgi:creatinine amidohydrolase/Fe(II)-dependent formamide hydrolase-like protein